MATTTTNIKINIVEPGSSTPVEDITSTTTTTDISTPDTGLFTHGIGGTEATIIGSVLFLLLSSIIVAILYKKHIKQGKVTKLVHIINQCKTKTVFTSKKRITASLFALALLASVGTLAILLAKSGKSNTNATEGNESSSLTLDVDSEELTIEVGDIPVFAYLPVELTVEEATEAGYTITAYTDSTDIVSTTDESNKIPMVAINEEDLSEYTSLTDNTWGLSLEKPEGENSEVYTNLSTDQSNPTILKTIDDYSETEANDTTTIYYGFYITPDTPKGTYEGSVTNYEATPNYITTLSFNGNGNDGGEDMDSIIIPAGTTITLPQNTYTKDGYHFTNWNTDAEGTGEAYAEETEYAAIAGESANVTLYAQWEEDVLYMQDVATWGSTLQIGDEITAVDSRDSKEYYVARLADNNIWMTQNLDLDIEAGRTYTSADTDLANSSIGTTWTPSASTSTISSWIGTKVAPESYDPGNLYWDGNITTANDTIDSSTVTESSTTSGGTHYHIGNFYNWTAAIAMNSSSGKNSGDMNQSICPAGWRMPAYSGDKSYQNLVNTQNLTAGTSGNVQNSPTYFVYSGSWTGSHYQIGGRGAYWSSVAKSSSTAYYFYFDTVNGLYPQGDGSKSTGYLLRCVAR